MKKDSLITDERNYARHLLFILQKLDTIDKKLSLKNKNKLVLFLNNKLVH